MLGKILLSDTAGAHWHGQQLREVRFVVSIVDEPRRGTESIYRQYMMSRVTGVKCPLVAWSQRQLEPGDEMAACLWKPKLFTKVW